MLTKEHDSIEGIIFPFLPEHAKRFLDGRKSVFVKFLSKGVLPIKLRRNSKLFFYRSRGNKEVVGEARIVEIGSGTFDEILERYGNELFLTPTELQAYVGKRRAKRMLTLVLEDAKEYAAPLRLEKSLTMAGRYMTTTMLKNSKRAPYG